MTRAAEGARENPRFIAVEIHGDDEIIRALKIPVKDVDRHGVCLFQAVRAGEHQCQRVIFILTVTVGENRKTDGHGGD